MSDWTPERVEALTALWRESLSASQIAGRLGGVTRNAVIGKAYRLGLPGRAGARRSVGHLRPATPPARPAVGPVPASPPPAGACRGVAMWAVRRGDCRWPIGDPLSADFRFCGARAVRGAYCAEHGALAYQASTEALDVARDQRGGGRRRPGAGA